MSRTRQAGLGALALLVVTTLLALQGIQVGEVAIVESFNGAPAAIENALKIPMQLGTRAAIPLVAIVAAVVADRRRWKVAGAVVVAGFLAWGASMMLKDAVDRPRPRPAGAAIVVHDSWGGPGYPSTHVAVATATLTAAALGLGRRAEGAVAVGAVVGVARIVVGAHLPLDVVGGLALGVLVAAATVELVDP